jgi:hypothetical protein
LIAGVLFGQLRENDRKVGYERKRQKWPSIGKYPHYRIKKKFTDNFL